MWGKGQLHTGFWRGCLSEKKNWRRWNDIIKVGVKKEDGVDRIDLAYNGERWPPFVNVVIKVRFP